MKKALEFVSSVNLKMCYVAMAAMFLLMCMASIDVVLRKAAIGGVPDGFDITEIFMVFIVFCGFALLESEKGHIRVDVFLNKFPKMLKRVTEGILYLLSSGILVMIAYSMFKFAVIRYNGGATTQILRIPYWPFVVIIAVALALYAITAILHTIEIVAGKDGNEKAK